MAASVREVQNLVTTVVGLQGNPVSPNTPASGDGLVWNGTEWVPNPVAVGAFLPLTGGELSGPGNLTVDGVLSVAGSSGTDNVVSLVELTGASGTIEAVGNGLTLTQTGDEFGSTSLFIANRTGLNGAMFINDSLDLVDFAFQTSSGVTGILRLEARGIPDGEFQFFLSNNLVTIIDSAGNLVTDGTITCDGIVGVTDGSDAAPGQVGEYQQAQTLFANAVQLTNSVTATVCSLNLSAGDWDCSATAQLSTNATGAVSSVTAWLAVEGGSGGLDVARVTTQYINTGWGEAVPTTRFSFAAPTTINLQMLATFVPATPTQAWGILVARRMR